MANQTSSAFARFLAIAVSSVACSSSDGAGPLDSSVVSRDAGSDVIAEDALLDSTQDATDVLSDAPPDRDRDTSVAELDAGLDGSGEQRDATDGASDVDGHAGDASSDVTTTDVMATDVDAVDVKATDTSATDPTCILEESSTLPGVRFAFRTSTCTFTLAQARSGIVIPYDLIVEREVVGFVPARPYPYGSDLANLDISAVVSGGTQSYCLCDIGLPYRQCPLSDGGLYRPDSGLFEPPCEPISIHAGLYHSQFLWDGVNWYGPSDTNRPKGLPFPPGDYELKIATEAGSIGDSGAVSAIARLRIHLVP